MYNKVKLSKRQIKEDKFTTFMLSSKQYASENWQYVALGAIGVVLLVFAVFYFMSSSAQKKTEAARQFSQALLDYRNGNNQQAILEFGKVVQDYSGDEAAQEATFMLARLNFEVRNYSEATNYYQQYLEKYRDDPTFRSAAYGGIAACHEDQGQFAEAAENYVKGYDELNNGPLAGDFLLGAMRNYLESGDTAKADEYLAKIKKEFEGTKLVDRAERMYAENTVESIE